MKKSGRRTMTDYTIQTKKLSKHFGDIVAVDALDLGVPEGSVLGFVGVNGAGKTTTLRMLMGHLHPSSGQMTVLGGDPREHSEVTRQQISYVSENMCLPAWMTPEQAVRFNAGLFKGWNGSLAKELLDEFELRGAGAFGRLSKGQKRKICILLAICQNAKLLIMDEPAAGLDMMARRSFLERVLEIVCNDSRTVLISSHLLSDLERIVDRISVIDQGRHIWNGYIDDLKSGIRKIHISRTVSEQEVAKFFTVMRHQSIGENETATTVLDFNDAGFSEFCRECDCAGKARVFGMNLEDIFIEMVEGNKQKQLCQKESVR
jgi:ABC-2 type transport system ATP-binding protein